MNPPIIDIHCHTFNADDLPIRGFVQRLHLRDVPLGGALSQLVDALIQTDAPGFEQDRGRLDGLLAGERLEGIFELPAAPPAADLEARLDSEVEELFQELKGRDPSLLMRVGAELTFAETRGGDGPEGIGEGPVDIYNAARRAVRWVTLFGKSRLDIAAHLIATFGDRIDMFCPLLVDLRGLGDVAKTTVRQQVELQEKISRLSMLGLLPGGGRGRIHPFVGFDPRHELQARLAEDIDTPLDVVKGAIERYGFVGVKLYPSMGWRPIGNQASFGMTSSEATELDSILREFYSWCESHHVPLAAHCNESNFAHDSYRDYSRPENWVEVLREFPELHLNLGHFGGARLAESSDGWPWRIARAAEPFHLYADVGNHPIHDRSLFTSYLEMLDTMFSGSQTAVMDQRIMFGTDWYMLALHPRHEDFLATYESEFRQRFGDDRTQRFLGGNALSFLGFGEQQNQNAQRLRARYERYAPERTPEWLS